MKPINSIIEPSVAGYTPQVACPLNRDVRYKDMKTIFVIGTMAAMFLATPIARGSQLYLIGLDELEPRSEVVLIATVTTVEEDPEAQNPVTGYDLLTLDVASVLKGTVSSPTIRLRLGTRGNRGFDQILKPNDRAVFFLIATEDGIYRTAYPGGVAKFQEGIYADKKKSEQGVAPYVAQGAPSGER